LNLHRVRVRRNYGRPRSNSFQADWQFCQFLVATVSLTLVAGANVSGRARLSVEFNQRVKHVKFSDVVTKRRTFVWAVATPASVDRGSLAMAIFFLCTLPLVAQDTPIGVPGTQVATEETPVAATSTDSLRKAAQNPVASLISVPIQENWNFNIGPSDRTQNVLNLQPVIPINAGKDWNLIIRWITPVIYQPVGVQQPPPQTGDPPTTQSGVYGFGDMQPAFFLSPKKSKVIWGVGPQLLLPTATKTGILGQGKFGLGPAAVVLIQPSKWTLGILINNVWSVAGHSDLPAVNQFLLQYFINYNLKKGYYITWQPTLTANWEATNGGRWVVPFGGGIGRIMKLGFQPVNVGLQFYGNAVHPPGGSPWSLRLQIAFLFPKLTKQQQKLMLEQKLKQMEKEQPPTN
jgi:hypothetical protein